MNQFLRGGGEDGGIKFVFLKNYFCGVGGAYLQNCPTNFSQILLYTKFLSSTVCTLVIIHTGRDRERKLFSGQGFRLEWV